MKWKYAILMFVFLTLAGCANVDKMEVQTNDNEYEDVKKVAWNYLLEQDWNDVVKGDWRSSEVTQVIADNEKYELLDEADVGREVASISFEELDDAVVAPPIVLVDSTTLELVGYMPGE